ncbi:MliC family protein [Pseudomonas chlororaphis]|uniref:Lysozyme inhibitor n=1 Tax=Pseudomonas chlororaphis TaxID=587753 RepID=A0AAX3FRD4_9PSED|nr:MliC family protein [Pseudomonas chlororaphis]AZC38834.1 Periplasmic lysozyme inhibitor of c-type lysozyme [Pseudomonas chlororaphis subsp. piscium]AZC45384.1 Periplasmic lysozyme inhibitor of c-type lysozyme [Pseudomonas chlororaphis subsp. piscium]WDG70946.1 MliC family protein [Pseudomonas chlororaphis]WDH31268.1 MliC family protein [Pseudomonas chlororaphis]WDH69472.1 MliC family protein [Pseudomonas chlororaphis]
MKISTILGTTLLLAPFFAQAATTPAEPELPAHQSSLASYRCEGGVEVQAAYLNIENGASFATLYYKGQLIPMHIARSGSGALYIADDEQNSYRWHTKGDSGLLSFLEADHTAKEQQLLKDCKEQKAEEQ